MKKYENVSFKQQYSIKIIEDFFRKFPEEKQGRKNFKNKEIQNIKLIIILFSLSWSCILYLYYSKNKHFVGTIPVFPSDDVTLVHLSSFKTV